MRAKAAPEDAPKEDPQLEDAAEEDGPEEEAFEEEPEAGQTAQAATARTAKSKKPTGDAIRRQTASVQRQLGRARGNGGFFVSDWFSDSPSTAPPAEESAKLDADYPLPEGDCDPLPNTIAEAYIRDSATREGISLDLVREVVRQESGFKPCAVSPKGAMGMMQLMPQTAASLGVADPFDARSNIDAGVRLLKRLMDKYQGRPDLALAAYNAGEGAVDANQGVPNFEETRNYVTTIMKRVFDRPDGAAGDDTVVPPAPIRIAPAASPKVPEPPKAPAAPTVPGSSRLPGSRMPSATEGPAPGSAAPSANP